MNENIIQMIKIINNSKNIVFFGGAGVSTESGIPDFRSNDSIYNKNFSRYMPEYLLSKDCFYGKPTLFYQFYRENFDVRKKEPNITHKALALMEQQGKLKGIITQNVDGFHQKAGSNNVIEIHGSIYKNYCVHCRSEFDSTFVFNNEKTIPRCPECQSLVRPDIVLYGEQLPYKAVNDAVKLIQSADCLIIGGTSLTVYPARDYINEFHGESIISINRSNIDFPFGENDVVIQENLSTVFEEIMKQI